MNKRAQFYLIAAIVIIGIIAGLSFVYINAKTSREDSSVKYLANEINFEVSQVVDSGVYNSLPEGDINENIENLTNHYAQANPEIDLLIVFGNTEQLTFIFYNNPNTAGINVFYNNEQVIVSPPKEPKTIKTIPRTGNQITVTLEDSTTQTYQLKERALFILLKKEKGGERFVATS